MAKKCENRWMIFLGQKDHEFLLRVQGVFSVKRRIKKRMVFTEAFKTLVLIVICLILQLKMD